MTKSNIATAVAVIAGLAVVALFFFIGNPFVGSSASSAAVSQAPSGAGLVAQDEVVGTGATAAVGDTVAVEYVGKLQDGTVFDSSSSHSGITPPCTKAGEYCFTIGAHTVIPGWEMGIQGMKVGGKRLLIIPPELGYGANQMGLIPANSTLIFEVTLDDVVQPGAAPTPVQ